MKNQDTEDSKLLAREIAAATAASMSVEDLPMSDAQVAQLEEKLRNASGATDDKKPTE